MWDVSLTGDFEDNDNYSKIIKALGAKELNDDSQVVPTSNLNTKISLIDELESNTELTKFFKWNREFPSHRADSPFRPVSSDRYFEQLLSQNDFKLIDEASRIKPQSAIGYAKKAAFRLGATEYPNESTKDLALADIIKAVNLNPNSNEVLLYAATVYEYLGNTEESENLFSQATALDEIKLEELLSLISIQDILLISDINRRKILDNAISKAKSDNKLTQELVIKRFNSAVSSSNFVQALNDWNLIKEWTETSTAFKTFLKAVENEADKLVENSKYEEAINLIKPSAVASITDTENENISSILTKLVEWENRDDPPFTIINKDSSWDYLDDGTDPGAEWFEPWAPTLGWSKGKAKFGYGDDGENTTLSYGPDLTNKHIAYYFRHQFEIDEDSIPSFLTINLVRDDGVVVYINGTEVLRNNMPNGEINHLTEASGTAGPSGELKFLTFSVSGSILEAGKNVIAAQVHQTDGKSSDIGFQLELLGSNQDVSSYVMTQLKDEAQKDLLDEAINLLPIDHRENANKAFKYNLGLIDLDELEASSFECGQLALNIADKLESRDIDELLSLQINILEKNPTTENLTKRVEVLNLKLNQLEKTGATKDTIDKIQKLIVTPSRNKDLSKNLVDLSDYYNASLFHHSSFHGKGTNNSLSFIHKYYDQENNIPFDLRGAIRLDSGLYDDGKTAGEKWLSGFKITYPTEVNDIMIDSKAKKIHFLMGSAFASWMKVGVKAATFKIHYKDKTFEEMPILALIDVIDWWEPHWNPGNTESLINEDKIGYFGEHQNGDMRVLTKPYWINPFPEKEISHIDFLNGDAKGSPFLIAITLE